MTKNSRMSRYNIETDMKPEQIREFANRIQHLVHVIEGVAESMEKSKIEYMTIENLRSGHLALDRMSAFLAGMQKGNINYAKEPLPPDPRAKKKKAAWKHLAILGYHKGSSLYAHRLKLR